MSCDLARFFISWDDVGNICIPVAKKVDDGTGLNISDLDEGRDRTKIKNKDKDYRLGTE